MFVTGVPGFLATALLPRILRRRPDANVVCLIQPVFAEAARRAIARVGPIAKAVRLVEGDITEPRLGLREGALLEHVTEIFHFAAVYDLAVSREVAERVNVHGTRRVLDVAAGLRRFERLHYVSTCYVSGCHPGRFLESDLECGQAFNNAYEATKYEAEVEVRARLRAGLPVTIYRPSIVVGDSTTGETTKYDGPYGAFRWLLRQGRVAVMPTVGAIRETRLNLVPRDFVVDAIDDLAAQSASIGQTYHLADPDPMTVEGVLEAFAAVTRQQLVTVRLPRALARAALERVPPISRWLGLSAASIDYFVHPTTYDTTCATRDLDAAGLRVPRLPEYLPALVEYMRAHPDRPAHGMR